MREWLKKPWAVGVLCAAALVCAVVVSTVYLRATGLTLHKAAVTPRVITAGETAPIGEQERGAKGNVYYTKSGAKYHEKNPCGRGTYYECTLSEAVGKGLEPCSVCVG